MPVDDPGSTAIVVLSPEVEPAIGPIFATHANAGRDGMTPHITLLVPFVPVDLFDQAVEHRLRRRLSSVEAFDYRLTRFASFDGVLYLAPEPAQPFIDLVLALAAEFPQYPPYEGVHDDVVPHLTVADSDEAELLHRIRAEVEPQLPIDCRARDATVVARGADRRWRPRLAFTFGSVE